MKPIRFGRYFILLALLAGCSGGAGRYLFYNKDYVLEKQDKYSIALFPPPDPTSFYWCEILTETFSYENDRLNIPSCGALYDKLRENDDLKILLSKVSELSYPDTEITYIPGLLDELSDDELIILRRFLDDADFLILPFYNPKMAEHDKIIYSWAFLRMFDLNSGELLFDKSIVIPFKKKEVDFNSIMAVLAGSSYAQFDSLFWRPFVLGVKDTLTLKK